MACSRLTIILNQKGDLTLCKTTFSLTKLNLKLFSRTFLSCKITFTIPTLIR
jgi:hypothetical protein